MTDLTPLVVKTLEDVKGEDITVLDVREMTDIADTMIIVSGTSSRHVKGLAENAVVEMKKQGHQPMGVEGMNEGEWVLVDFGTLILHAMQKPTRELYDLESLWTAAEEFRED